MRTIKYMDSLCVEKEIKTRHFIILHWTLVISAMVSMCLLCMSCWASDELLHTDCTCCRRPRPLNDYICR